MKKIILIGILLLLFFFLINIYPQKEKSLEVQKEMIEKKYPFYKNELENRYQTYQKEHPELKEIDIITRVNLNLDKPFYTNTKEAKIKNSNTVLVNKYHYLTEIDIPNNLEQLTICNNGTHYLTKEAKEAFESMCQDAKKENLNIRAISSYRSYDYQKQLYDRYVEKDGVKKADTYSARPGFSEHQTGLVIDVDNIEKEFENFENTKEFEWMKENAKKYGFILRYPKGKENITGYSYEAWHYRYVGKMVAQKIDKENLTLDEYYVRYVEQ